MTTGYLLRISDGRRLGRRASSMGGWSPDAIRRRIEEGAIPIRDNRSSRGGRIKG
jgi:hypothetical protein